MKRCRAYSSFKGNIWDADLGDMQLISKYNKGFRYLLCVTDLFSENAWVVKKVTNIVIAFQSILNDLERKPNKIRVNESSEFYKKSFEK